MTTSHKYIAIVKEEQHFLFRYRSGDEPLLLKAVLRFARDEACNLDYADVVAFVKRIRDTMVDELNQQEKV